ncbi:MAG: hypothetical protein HN608_12035, partial [Rhodospirillaceae bacterium]|nr:hypothetical protein [Rhodospirillaceae bacterium]
MTGFAGAAVCAFAALASINLAAAQEKGLFLYGGQLEELEYRAGDEGEEIMAWGGNAFVGTDELKLRWISEGEYDNRDSS